MDHLFKLVALTGFFCASSAWAGYAQISTPEGFRPVPVQGQAFTTSKWTYQASANRSWSGAGTVLSNSSLNVGGRAITVPLGMRTAANAGRYVLRGLAGGWIGVGLAAALAVPEVVSWLDDAGVRSHEGKWQVHADSSGYWQSDGWMYAVRGYTGASPRSACQRYLDADTSILLSRHEINSVTPTSWTSYTCSYTSYLKSGNVFKTDVSVGRSVASPCPNGHYVSPDGICFAPGDVWKDADFETEVLPKIGDLPAAVPNALPVPVPVETPMINPSADPAVNPAAKPQPMTVPNGLPQPVPNTTPQQYAQPVTQVTPANNPNNPLQVDVQPDTLIGTDPNGLQDPETNPEGQPAPNPQPSNSPQQQLCAVYPEVLACQNLDDPDDIGKEELDQENKSISITPDSGWGSSNATCPAPRVISPMGHRIEIPFDLWCTFMQGIRPIVIAMAWLSAAFIVLGFKQEG